MNGITWAPTGLPVEAALGQVAAALGSVGVGVVTAEPGAGKSSLVPLAAAQETSGRVVLLQPRRVAARATAERLASLLGEPVGQRIGLTMRGERKVSRNCRIEVVTEAILTNRVQSDPDLPGVGAVIFDEFHERSLHADLGLAMCAESRLLVRPDLKIIVMSATIDPARVARLLGGAPVIAVAGRTYPVETFHHERPDRRRWVEAVAAATKRAMDQHDGDLLVFAPGRGEVERVAGALKATVAAEVLTLHGGTSPASQRAALAGGQRRRVIVATTIAETSITVPGVAIVVDGGLARRPVFDAMTGLGSLETGFVSRFSADQRRGRAGRVRAGVCHRLWSAEDHLHLAEGFDPEILTGDPIILSVALARWGDPDAADLPLLDRPGPHRLAAARSTLLQMNITDENGRLTNLGSTVASLPIHPRWGAAALNAPPGPIRDRIIALAGVVEEDVRLSTCDLETVSKSELDKGRRTSETLQKRTRGVARTAVDSAGPPPSSVAECLVDAWPDRIGQQRPGRPGSYLLAAGTEVVLPESDPLRGAEFIVVASASGRPPAIRVRAAMAVDRSVVLDRLGSQIEEVDVVEWDERADRVVAQIQDRLGAIVLKAVPISDPDAEAVKAALADAVRSVGLDGLRWTEFGREVLARLRWLHSESPSDWPALTDFDLLDRLGDWVTAGDAVRPSELTAGSGLLDLLDWKQRAALDELAPVSLRPPSGSVRPIDYSTGRPVWSVRLQNLFGLDTHPRLGPNGVPVTIELLTPANRPAQTTGDLPGFWRGSYAEVRKDLRGRYPKHAWPEDPLS